MAYPFKGYWKDVGTVESLWEANMDLLNKDVDFDIYDKNWKIYSQAHNKPGQVIGETAKIKNSLITEGCVIEGEVENSVLFSGVHIEKGAKVTNSVIMCDTVIGKNSTVDKAIFGRKVVVKDNLEIAGKSEILLVEEDRVVTENIIK